MTDNAFLHIFAGPLMVKLFEFLLTINQDSNSSPDLNNLIQCNKSLISGQYLSRKRYKFTKISLQKSAPDTVHRIIYDSRNQINDSLTPYHKLKFLNLGFMYNHPLNRGEIPGTVTHFAFGHQFNHPLKPGDIPQSVTHLALGGLFNQPLRPGDIPNSVTHLKFSQHFTKPLGPNVIPGSVTCLKFKYFLSCMCAISRISEISFIWQKFLSITKIKSHPRISDLSACSH